LELGCGTGNLSMYIHQVFPNAKLTLVDLSPDMLEQAGQKLNAQGIQPTLVEGGFMDITFPQKSFDLVVSSMALHHLTDPEKPIVYQRIYEWLRPGGLFRCADETMALPPKAHEANLLRWEAWARENGASEEEIALWSEHAETYDHYAPLILHCEWLKQAGFIHVDCHWRKLMWTVFGGEKPSAIEG
jgi:tRNA (cmo5U34)-methyltransferase